eukprot:3939605-Rhodomonas_salina.1
MAPRLTREKKKLPQAHKEMRVKTNAYLCRCIEALNNKDDNDARLCVRELTATLRTARELYVGKRNCEANETLRHVTQTVTRVRDYCNVFFLDQLEVYDDLNNVMGTRAQQLLQTPAAKQDAEPQPEPTARSPTAAEALMGRQQQSKVDEIGSHAGLFNHAHSKPAQHEAHAAPEGRPLERAQLLAQASVLRLLQPRAKRLMLELLTSLPEIALQLVDALHVEHEHNQHSRAHTVRHNQRMGELARGVRHHQPVNDLVHCHVEHREHDANHHANGGEEAGVLLKRSEHNQTLRMAHDKCL